MNILNIYDAKTKPRVTFDVAKRDFKQPISDDQLMGDDPDIQTMFYGVRG